MLNLQSVGRAGLVVSEAEPAVFDDEVRASRQRDGPRRVNIINLDPEDRKVSDVLHWAFKLNGSTNVNHLLLWDVRDGRETLTTYWNDK